MQNHNMSTIQEHIEEKIKELYIALQYTIDREGEVDETAMKNQLREALSSIALATAKEMMKIVPKEKEQLDKTTQIITELVMR